MPIDDGVIEFELSCFEGGGDFLSVLGKDFATREVFEGFREG